MKKSLAHLMPYKCEELKVVTEIIRRELRGVEMIILFGESAGGRTGRGSLVGGQFVLESRLNYNILVVMRSKALAESAMRGDVDELICKCKQVNTEVGIIFHHSEYVNGQLRKGHCFFFDLKTEGIVLYDSGNVRLKWARRPHALERERIAQDEFRHWFKSAQAFYSAYELMFERGEYRNAAFQLHQATEHFYATNQLVFINYRLETHDIERLGRFVRNFDHRFGSVFPHSTKEDKRTFELLKKAYIDARYKRSYSIIAEELAYLGSCVKQLERLTKEVCERKMAEILSGNIERLPPLLIGTDSVNGKVHACDSEVVVLWRGGSQ